MARIRSTTVLSYPVSSDVVYQVAVISKILGISALKRTVLPIGCASIRIAPPPNIMDFVSININIMCILIRLKARLLASIYFKYSVDSPPKEFTEYGSLPKPAVPYPFKGRLPLPPLCERFFGFHPRPGDVLSP